MPSVFYREALAHPLGHGRLVGTLDTTVDGGIACETMGPAAGYCHPVYEAIRSWLGSTLLPEHGDMFSCLLHTKVI